MLSFIEVNLKKVAVHIVGNKLREEGVAFSAGLLPCEDDFKYMFLNYVLRPFKGQKWFNLHHPSDIRLNIVYECARKIFDNPESLFEQSQNLAHHLYDHSTHPNVRGGEFYVAYFENVVANGEMCDAIGIFKSETKERFLKVLPSNNGYDVVPDRGTSVEKLDRGCLILNTKKENGFMVSVVDSKKNTNYWTNDFLQVVPCNDSYFNTERILALYRNFVASEMPNQFEISPVDQSDLLNKASNFFKQNDNFDIDAFANEVIIQPEIIEYFKQFKAEYEKNHELKSLDNFVISEDSIKANKRLFKRIIKLDKNFRIHIDSNNDLIERGSDADGHKFYKIYYQEEI